MKCRKCGAVSEVLETRDRTPWIRRTRRCFNGHKFLTYEVYPGNLDKRTKEPTQRKINVASMAAKRSLKVRSNPGKSASVLAAELGITEARVRQIRKETK